MLKAKSSHTHGTHSRTSWGQGRSQAATESSSPSMMASPFMSALQAKKARQSSSSVPTPQDDLTACLGLDKDPPMDIQEAFGSLFNAQDILGAMSDTLSDEVEGEKDFWWAYKKLHHLMPSKSESLAWMQVSAASYSQLTKVFALEATIEAWLKLQILKGLFVPSEVLLMSDKGICIHQYLHNTFLSPGHDPKL